MVSDKPVTWDRYVDWILGIALIITTIYAVNAFLHQPKIEIARDSFGVYCISDYDYRVNQMCMYYNYTSPIKLQVFDINNNKMVNGLGSDITVKGLVPIGYNLSK